MPVDPVAEAHHVDLVGCESTRWCGGEVEVGRGGEFVPRPGVFFARGAFVSLDV